MEDKNGSAIERKPFGWFRTPKDYPLQGMFLHYDPEHGERDIQNALDFGFTVKRLYDTQAVQPQSDGVNWSGVANEQKGIIEQQQNLIASLRDELAESYRIDSQPQGEPVACVIAFREGVKEPEVLSWNQLPVGEHQLYAEQPAPVAVSPICCGSCPGGCVIQAATK